jgi:hypothetical protein
MQDSTRSIRSAARDRSSLRSSFHSEQRNWNGEASAPAASDTTVDASPFVLMPPIKKSVSPTRLLILQVSGRRIWRPCFASTPHLTFDQVVRRLPDFLIPFEFMKLNPPQCATGLRSLANGCCGAAAISPHREIGASLPG